MNVTVDLNVCASTGTCIRTAPEVFQFGDDGVLQVVHPEPPEEHRAQVEEAVDLCPTGAIALKDDA